MEEMNNKNENQDVKIETTKRLKKWPRIAIFVLFIVAILLVSQVYASANGYGNIFFMIKSVFSNEEVKGVDNLLSDRDITISYSSIEVTKGLKVQVQRVTIEKDETTIYLYCQNEDSKKNTPLKYKVYDKENNILTENLGSTTEERIYTDIIKINKEIDPKTTIKLGIYDNSEKLLSEITIDLANKELLVGNEKVEKISEIELKKYLSAFAMLIDNTTNKQNIIATAMNLDKVILGNEQHKREVINNIIDSYWNKDIEKKNGIIDGISVVDMNKNNYLIKQGEGDIAYYQDSDTYDFFQSGGTYVYMKCLDISDISYNDGIYTITFVYINAEPGLDINIEEADQYEATIQLKYNKNSEYSKYKIVSITEGELIKENSNQPEKTVDYSSFIEQYMKNNKLKSIEYGYFDIDKDGTKELIIVTGDYEAKDTRICFYTYKKDVVSLGSASGYHTTLNYANDKLLLKYKYMSTSNEYINEVSMRNDSLAISNTIYEPSDDYKNAEKLELKKLTNNANIEETTNIEVDTSELGIEAKCTKIEYSKTENQTHIEFEINNNLNKTVNAEIIFYNENNEIARIQAIIEPGNSVNSTTIFVNLSSVDRIKFVNTEKIIEVDTSELGFEVKVKSPTYSSNQTTFEFEANNTLEKDIIANCILYKNNNQICEVMTSFGVGKNEGSFTIQGDYTSADEIKFVNTEKNNEDV